MSALLDAVRLAVGTLTVLPVRPPGRMDRAVAGLAMALAPVAVLPLALAAGGTAWLAATVSAPPLLAAVLTVVVLGLGTGGLHLDGLADTADGLAVPGDRTRRLQVMRSGDVGPGGTATLLLVVLVQVAALAEVLGTRGGQRGALVVALAVLASRTALTLACARGIPGARADGLGAAVAGSVPLPLAVLVIAAVGAASGLGLGLPGLAGAGGALLATAVVVLRARARIGGVTGDVLGAGVELALAGYLVVQALA